MCSCSLYFVGFFYFFKNEVGYRDGSKQQKGKEEGMG